jgi:pantetheine-phosphate adenylyltransferase
MRFMVDSDSRIAVFPGSFDPLTLGHLDIIKRGAALFPRFIVGVGHNPEKQELFTPQERIDMISREVNDLDNVEAQAYAGLTMSFLQKVGAGIIVRGIRDSVDLRSELQAANANLLVGGVETVFLMTSDQHALTSSTLIKQIVALGGYQPDRLLRLVPQIVLDQLREKLN